MKLNLFARSLSVLILVTSSVVGFASAASAAPAALTDATATSSSEIGITGTNATGITIAATSVTGAPANMFNVNLPSGWSFVSPGAGCSDMTLIGFTGSPSCQAINFSATSGFASIQLPAGTFTAGQALSVTFAATTVNVSGTRNFTVTLANSLVNGAAVDSGTAVLAGGVTQSTVTFDANGGAGAMADQVASSAIALTASTFSRTGYSFGGWNTAADGLGTAYADTASYPFTASTTLYALWTPVLANTGTRGLDLLDGAAWLLIAGAGLVVVSVLSRKSLRSN